MLSDLLRTHYQHFESLADAWLVNGASAFSVWEENQMLACWPSERCSDEPGLSAAISFGGRSIGDLRVSGMTGLAEHARLAAEAGLLSSLAHLTRDLFGITNELINARDQLLAIYNLTQVNRRSLEINQAVQNLVAELPRLIKTENAFVQVQIEGQNQPLTAHFPYSIFEAERLWNLSAQIGKEHLLITRETARGAAAEGWPEDVRSLLIVPFQARGTSHAVLGWINKINGDFMSPDIKLARAIAAYTGAQIENILMIQDSMRLARLQTEMELAQRVQVSLLPKDPPVIDGIDLFASSFPASLVGGDFYDFIVRPGLPMTMAVGDLSGKGFPAALLMSMTRTVLRTEMNVFSTPESILLGVNRELYDDFTRLSTFATLFVGQYSPERRELYYANAGHSPVIYRPAGQTARLLVADGTAMGILPDSQSKDQCLVLQVGDVLLVGTDGLPEARNQQGQRFGYARLLSLTDSISQLPAREIAQKIYDTIGDFSAGLPQEDDQTLVVMKCISA